MNNYRNWGRILIRCWIHKNIPYLVLTVELWCVCCEYLWENWLRYDRTTLYLERLSLYWNRAQDSHYNDVIMGTMASQITSLTIVYSIVYSGADQSKHQSFVSLAFVRGIHQGPVNSLHKWPVTRKMFPFDDVIMVVRQWLPACMPYWQKISTQVKLHIKS